MDSHIFIGHKGHKYGTLLSLIKLHVVFTRLMLLVVPWR